MSEKELSHLKKLQMKHQELDTKIKEAYNSYSDDTILGKMKQEKLYIKNQIEKLKKKMLDEA